MFPRTPFMRRAVASYVRAMQSSARAKRAEDKIVREENVKRLVREEGRALAHAGAGMPSRSGSLTMPMDVAVATPKNELEEDARHKQVQQLERDIKFKRVSQPRESAAGAPLVKAAGEPEPQPLALPALTLSLILNEEPTPLTDHGEFVVFTRSAAMRLHYCFKLWVAKAHLNGLPFSAASPFALWLRIYRMGFDRGTTQLEFLVAYSQHLKHWKFFFLPNHSDVYVDVD